MDQNRSRCDSGRFQQNRNFQHQDNRMMNNSRNSCECGNSQRTAARDSSCRTESEMQGVHLAMAYMPWQKFGETFSCSDGFQKGTIFPELFKPFLRGGCGK